MNPHAYQDRLDRHRVLNNNKKNSLCFFPGCNFKMVGIIDGNPYCKKHHEQYFINLNKERKKGLK